MQALRSLLVSMLLAGLSCGQASAIAQQPLETGQPQDGLSLVGEYGRHEFKSPETAIWDEREDVYLVSNVHGELDLPDDNGFISRIAPNGNIIDLKWIDGVRREVTLHAPKDMLLTERHLVVADVGAVRFFDRKSGEPAGSVVIPDSFMLNGLAIAPDGKSIYVTDTGGSTDEEPGAVFRITRNSFDVVTRGPQLDKPNGIIPDGEGFLYAPFRRHSDTLVHLSLNGERKQAGAVPGTQLDGLLRLPDGSLIVTSWQEKAVFRLAADGAETLITNIKAPAQIGHDPRRQRLLVPLPQEHRLMVFELPEPNR